MRVISGTYRGRKLECPPGDSIRPTTDRVKENLFNILASVVPYSSFLDVFSGSGGIGIEAISRGASQVVMIDAEPSSIRALRKNLAGLKITEGYEIFESDAFNVMERFSGNRTFDIIFMDPPYKTGLYQRGLDAIAENGLLSEDGIVAVERHVDDAPEHLPEALELIKERKYGSIVLDFYKLK